MKRATALRRFRNNEAGAISIWMGLGLSSMLGAGAIAIDLGGMMTTRGQLQHTADAAAIAAAQALPDQTAAASAAASYVEKNMPAATHGTVLAGTGLVFGNWNAGSRTFTASGSPTNAVRAVARRASANNNPAKTLLASALGIASVDLSAAAIAAQKTGAGGNPLCMLALHPSAGKALEVNSNAKITASNCDIQVNSSASDAVYTDSNALVTISAGGVCVTGGYQVKSNSDIDPPPTTGCPTVADPMAGLAAPPTGPCNHNGFEADNATVTLNPGVYCGGLTIKGNSTVSLNPGVYVVRDSEFLVDSNSSLSGSGVMIYLADGAYVNFNSNTTVTLSAPTSGPYTGVLLFAEPGNGLNHRLDSNNVSSFAGLIYLPGDRFEANSNTQVSNGAVFSWLIANTFYLDSNAHLQVDPTASGVPLPPGIASGLVSLVN